MSEVKKILDVSLEDNKIKVNIYSNHLPMLCYALKLLEVEIMSKVLDKQLEEKPLIQEISCKELLGRINK